MTSLRGPAPLHRPHTLPDTLTGVFDVAAAQAGGTLRRQYLIGGHRVNLHFAGPSLLPLVEAFAHLAVDSSIPPVATVLLADEASTGLALPLPEGLETEGKAGTTWYLPGPGGTCFWYLCEHGAGMFDSARRVGLFWAHDAERLPLYEYGSPLLRQMHWLFSTTNCQLIHGAAVGTAAGGVLLAGRGGAGKSTSAMACLLGGMKYVGDDYCLVAEEAELWAHSLYSTGKLRWGNLERLGAGLPTPRDPAGEKALYFLRGRFSGQICTGLPLRAVVIPQVTGNRDTRLRPATPAEAFLAAAPSTVGQLPGESAASYQRIARIMRRLPCHVLEAGEDLPQIPQALCRLIEGG